MTERTIRILTVCTGNICRSPMAEGILRRIFEHNGSAVISSAGTHALEGNPASEFSIIAAYENGIDISGHRARMLNSEMIRSSDVILCMEPSHLERVLSIGVSVNGRLYNLADFSGVKRMKSIRDPYGCSLCEYRECFEDIKRCCSHFMDSGKMPENFLTGNRK